MPDCVTIANQGSGDSQVSGRAIVGVLRQLQNLGLRFDDSGRIPDHTPLTRFDNNTSRRVTAFGRSLGLDLLVTGRDGRSADVDLRAESLSGPPVRVSTRPA